MVFEDVDEPRVQRQDIVSSDTHRERFPYLYGLRGLAILSVVLAEVVRHAPRLLAGQPLALRAARGGIHGLDLFFVISGFALAYPALAIMRQDGGAYLDVARYGVKRLFRIFPVYWVALALTVAIPELASRYGIVSVAGFRSPHAWTSLTAQAFFFGNDIVNDGFWTLGVIARWYLVFPLLLGLWVRAPRGFAMLAIALSAGDLLTPAHSIGVGALVACMLGIVAADLKVQNPAWTRFAFLFALLAAGCAALLDPDIAALPGPLVDASIYPSNPLWQVAAFAFLVAVGRTRLIERVFSSPVLGVVGAASFGIALVAEPMVVFILHQATRRVGVLGSAVDAYLAALVVGFILWQVVDRWFADTSVRQSIADRVAPLVSRALAPIHFDRVDLIDPGRLEDEIAAAGASNLPSSFYAPPPRPEAGDMATIMRRTGSPEDLAAEILNAKKRLAERSLEILNAYEAPVVEPDPYEPPGFYIKPSDLVQKSPARAPAPAAETAELPKVRVEPAREPVVAAKPQPVVAAEPAPVVAAEPDPVAAAEPDPVVAAEPEPVASAEPKPVMAAASAAPAQEPAAPGLLEIETLAEVPVAPANDVAPAAAAAEAAPEPPRRIFIRAVAAPRRAPESTPLELRITPLKPAAAAPAPAAPDVLAPATAAAAEPAPQPAIVHTPVAAPEPEAAPASPPPEPASDDDAPERRVKFTLRPMRAATPLRGSAGAPVPLQIKLSANGERPTTGRN